MNKRLYLLLAMFAMVVLPCMADAAMINDDYPDHSDARPFLRGGDLTMATYIEDWGALFRYEDGTAGDVFDIMEHYGVNLVRLRLYNSPGTGVKDGSTTYRTPIVSKKYSQGYPYAGEDDVAALALRAKEHHMQICLSFHLSDYWTNASRQMIPSAWAEAGSLEALGDSVYNFVYRYMLRLQAQGTVPEYVSVGNETNYPHWASLQKSSDNTPTGMLVWAKAMEKAIGKPIMLIETGYSWTQYRPSGRNGGNYEGQLSTNGSYKEATAEGQRDFLCALHDAIASDTAILGYMYWDPIFVDYKVNGSWIKSCWAEKYDPSYNKWWEDGNVVSNTTLFDYEGKALPALYQEINSRQPKKPEEHTALEQISAPTKTRKIMENGTLYIIQDDKRYTVLGIETK